MMRDDIEMCDNEDSHLLSEERVNLRIRTKEGSELEIAVPYSGIVKDLKDEITDRLHLTDKHIRLIYSGKLLEPPDASLSLFKLKDGSFIHAVITEKSLHNNSSLRESSSVSSNRIDITNLRGLDTLMLPGEHRSTLSLEEVTSLRSYFQADITEYADEHMQRQPNENDTDFHYRCETEWMAVQGPSSEFRLNLYGRALFSMNPALLSIERLGNETVSSGAGARALQLSYDHDINGTTATGGINGIEQGTWREFACGTLMGFGCGYMMLFCMWDRNISQKQKLGILVGMVISMLLSMTIQEQAGGSRHSSNATTSKSAYTTASSSSTSTTGNTNRLPDFPVIEGFTT